MHIALYQPDIPQNTGAILRLGACFRLPVHLIEPCGFDTSDRALRRAGLDYLAHAHIQRHRSFAAFDSWRRTQGLRLVLLTTRATMAFTDLRYDSTDVLMLGRESCGVPEQVQQIADARVRIPMADGMRSLNQAMAAAIAVSEALRQCDGFNDLA
ncbi:MAG: tRNA (cytidine(34)-2'-O)-methyltransferase [Methyloligellaceae bacterium]